MVPPETTALMSVISRIDAKMAGNALSKRDVRIVIGRREAR